MKQDSENGLQISTSQLQGDVSFSSKYPIKRLFLIKSDFVSENALKTFKSELAFIHNENIKEDECLPKAVDYS